MSPLIPKVPERPPPFLPLTPHDQSHNRNNQRRDTRQLQRLRRNTLLAAMDRRDRRIGKRRPTALVDLHRRSDIRRRHRLTQVTRRAGEDVHRVLQALGTGRPTRARQRDAQREERHGAIARTRRVGDGGREAVVALRVLEASGLVEGRVGDQAVVRLHDEGIFVGIVIAAVGVAAELGGERAHEGGAGGEGDGTCCVESVGDEGDGLLRQEKGVGVLRTGSVSEAGVYTGRSGRKWREETGGDEDGHEGVGKELWHKGVGKHTWSRRLRGRHFWNVALLRKELKKSGQLELVKLLLRLVSKGFGRVVEAGAAVINEEDAGETLVAEELGEAVVDAGTEALVEETAIEVDDSTPAVDEGPEAVEPNRSPLFCRRQRFKSTGATGCGLVSTNNSSY